MKHKSELEAQYEWSRKGKKYKTKYFQALGQLFGEPRHDKEGQPASHSNRGSGTDHVGDLVNKARN